MPNKIDRKLIGYRPTWAEVSLGNIAYNLRQLRRMVAKNIKIMVTVKADAYGHGLIPVSRMLTFCGVDYLGVASMDEGVRLRKEKINLPILIMGMVLKGDLEGLLDYNLTPTICTFELARELNKKAKKRGIKKKIHVKVDTGMARLGVLHEDAMDLVKKILDLNFLQIEGVFTHFAFADMNRKFTYYQIRLFDKFIKRLKSQGINIPLVHAANSMGLIGYKDGHFNMVRPGLAVYGLYPKKRLKIKLKPVLSLKTKIVYLKKVPKGSGVSYGHIYVTKKDTQIATLPIGYGDGYPRNLSNLAPVLINGKKFRISGRICMDQVMVDVGKSRVRIGSEAVLIGKQGKLSVSAEQLAEISGTIPYEIVCGLGGRVPRVYL